MKLSLLSLSAFLWAERNDWSRVILRIVRTRRSVAVSCFLMFLAPVARLKRSGARRGQVRSRHHFSRFSAGSSSRSARKAISRRFADPRCIGGNAMVKNFIATTYCDDR